MMDHYRKTVSFWLAILFAAQGVTATVAAQDHVVSRGDLRQEVVRSQSVRRSNLAQVRNFFSSKAAHKALKVAHLEPTRVNKAVAQLSDDELASLASRTNQIERDFRAGALTNQQLTYIIIAIATALLVTLIFVAR
jgi:hypothetical protein